MKFLYKTWLMPESIGTSWKYNFFLIVHDSWVIYNSMGFKSLGLRLKTIFNHSKYILKRHSNCFLYKQTDLMVPFPLFGPIFESFNCIPGRSRGYFGFGPVRCRQKLFGFRRLQTTILKGLFSYLVYTFGGLWSRHPSKMVQVGSFPRGWGAKNHPN
jgi:hypothetical protein